MAVRPQRASATVAEGPTASAKPSSRPAAAPEWARGVILQASYRIVGGAPVVHLYGALERGGAFLVRDHRQRPHFHIRRRDAAAAFALGARRQRETAGRTFDGEPALRVDVATPPDAPPLRDRLEANGIATFEADVRFAMRYLIDRNVRGGCEIRGPWQPGARIGRVYDDAEVRPADVAFAPKVLSFDIETDPQAKRLLAIAVFCRADGEVVDEVFIVDAAGRPMPPNAIACASEAAAVDAFVARVQALDPDVLTGWNVIDFDLKVLGQVAKRVRRPLALGRDVGDVRVRPARGYFGSGQASVPGRLVLDGMDLVRGAFLRMDDYSLDGVASAVLGEGKVGLGSGSGGNRADAILARYQSDLPTFAEYARTDARLALAIVEKLDLVNLAFARARLAGMTPDRVAASIASFDFLYLAALRRRRIVAPTVRSSDANVSSRQRQAGGHVFEPVTGIHDNVWVFDFKSLYPSVIRTFNIDPLGFAQASACAEPVRVAEGAAFARGEAILPTMLDALFPQREAAKRQGDAVASQAIKILMNSFYGVLGTPACRFHNVAIANAITGLGRHLLQWAKAWFENQGYAVLYGDTDSVFVGSGLPLPAAREAAPRLATAMNEAAAAYVRDKWGVTSRLELEFEKLYVKLFLPSVRHGGAGARKRYAGLIDGSEAVDFVGMEVVRRDWTDLAKDVQRELYARLFAGDAVDGYLARVAAELRQGQLDAKLVYRKGLRKRPQDYTANTPPHVAAARKSATTGRVVEYVMTKGGPEPVDAVQSELDREHYLDRQVRPVAEPVLAALGLDFDQVVGDDRQMALF